MLKDKFGEKGWYRVRLVVVDEHMKVDKTIGGQLYKRGLHNYLEHRFALHDTFQR